MTKVRGFSPTLQSDFAGNRCKLENTCLREGVVGAEDNVEEIDEGKEVDQVGGDRFVGAVVVKGFARL